jgi:N-acetylglucosaminyldiphosphoundecaprenol N-acetyl-beta-D-mannosaminyltransferase
VENKVSQKKRYYFLKVPVDVVDEETCFHLIGKMLSSGQNHQISFLDMKGLFRARRRMLYYKCLYESSLILPSARGIIRGLRFLRRVRAFRYNPFDFIISLLSYAEKNGLSVYLFGARKQDLEKAEQNVRTSFPALKIIGRHAGYSSPEVEKDILTAIKKSAPSFILIGRGLRERDVWIHRHREDLQKGVAVYVDDCFEIFAGRVKYVNEKTFAAGLESATGVFSHPWRALRLLRYFWFNFLLLAYKIFKL